MFIENSNIAGIAYTGRSFGSSWGDFNGDGFDDLWVTNHFDQGQLFLNQQDGTFTDTSDTVFAIRSERDEHGAAWADFDNDGDLDQIQTVGGNSQMGPGGPNLFYINTEGLLVDEAEARGVTYQLGRGRTPVWFDYDNDGLLDLWIGNLSRRDREAPPTFFNQTDDNLFVDVRDETGVRVGQSDFAILSDLTGDGKLDLISRGFDPDNSFEKITVYDMTVLPFSNVTNSLLPDNLNASDIVAADFNNDLLSDLYLANNDEDFLLINNGETLVDVTETSGITNDQGDSTSVVAGDFDNDMDVDIYLVKGNLEGNSPNILYDNQGDGTFVALEDADGAAGTVEGSADTVTVADYDRDGFLDLFTTNGISEDVPFGPSQLFRNQGNDNNWLEISLEGTVSNRDGIGARVLVTAGGVTQVREQSGGVHRFSQNSSVLHFGLGSNTTVDEISFQWSSGIEQTFSNVEVNQFVEVQELGSVVYRFFNPNLGVHFYTASVQERDFVESNLDNYEFEGASYLAAPQNSDSLTGIKPVYRFFNQNTGVHVYTIDTVERDFIEDNLDNYVFEDIAYYAYETNQEGTIPVYRFYNSEVDAHFYTPSIEERNFTIDNLPNYQLEGQNQDGEVFYVLPISEDSAI